MINWGYVLAGTTTLPFPITTHAQTGAAVAPSSAFEVGDFILYKNGSATQRSSTAGWTITSPFDSITGLHMLLIDLSDNTDAGFYSAGAFYTLVLSPDETVDTLAVVRVVGTFIIGPVAANTTQWLGTAAASPATAGIPDVNVKNINNVVAATPGASGGIVIAGSNAATTFAGLTTGALSTTTITASGAVAFQSTFAVTTSTSLAALSATTFATSGTTTLNALTITNNLLVSGTSTFTGILTATNVGNSIVGVTGALTAAGNNAIADAFLDRDMSTGADSGSTTVRTPRQALRFLRNKWSISGTTLTVYKENDSTTSWTSTVTGTPGADPITENDPAGP